MKPDLDRFPEGYSVAQFRGVRYGVTKTTHSGGRSVKFYGEEVGGSDFVNGLLAVEPAAA